MEAIAESVFGGSTPYRPASSHSPSMRRISLTHNTISHVHFVSQLARGSTAVVSIQVKDNPMDPKKQSQMMTDHDHTHSVSVLNLRPSIAAMPAGALCLPN